MNLPTMPGSSISGRNAAMVVSTEAVTGANTSRSASMLAVTASMPRVMR